MELRKAGKIALFSTVVLLAGGTGAVAQAEAPRTWSTQAEPGPALGGPVQFYTGNRRVVLDGLMGTTVFTARVPAGSYLVDAQVQVLPSGGARGEFVADCTLSAIHGYGVNTSSTSHRMVMELHNAFTATGDLDVMIRCNGGAADKSFAVETGLITVTVQKVSQVTITRF
ncbi:hypothetical protein [Planobispora takensis]|uniref:Secreted protein n=1 Tax=Planobispora takensis TaxID=1367882 RepID=A0A8J3TBB1_9ACTN|nr:hypothetical protein [Planobispora takensis]GII04264.1 hypothetical protein Pta02_62720 [Planobispora takensis]